MGQHRQRTEHEQWRQQQAQKQHYKATMARYQESMRDRVKQRLAEYLYNNPQWTVEDLKHYIRMYERLYGITNRFEGGPNDTGGPEEPAQDPS